MADRFKDDFARPDVVHIKATWEPDERTSETEYGTGFVIRKGVIATALHVVADRKTNPPRLRDLEVTFCRRASGDVPEYASIGPERIKLLSWPDNPQDEDWVLLSFEPEDEWPALTPCAQVTRGAAFYSYGFARDEGKAMEGTISSCGTPLDGKLYLQLRVEQLQASVADDVAGDSGAPVMVAGHVVGLIRTREPGGPHERDHENLAKGATLYATPISWLRDEHDQPICPYLEDFADQAADIAARVLPLLTGSRELCVAVLDEFESDTDRRLDAAVLAEEAAECVSARPRLEQLLDAAQTAEEAGAKLVAIRALLGHTLRGCIDYQQMAARFRQDIHSDDVTVLEFPVGTLAQAEIVMAASDHRPAALEYVADRLAGKSHVQVSEFQPDAAIAQGARRSDAVFVSVVVKLANGRLEQPVRPEQVRQYLRHTDDAVRELHPVHRILDNLNRMIDRRTRRIRAHLPPFYVAVSNRQRDGLDTLKKFLPQLRVGVLNASALDSFNDVLISLFAGE